MTKEDEKLFRTIGKRIRELRIKAGYKSQEAFAYEASIPRAQYGRYEKGVNITISSLKKVIKYHKISLADFFKDID